MARLILNSLKLFLAISSLLLLLSCTNSPPYEIKSPCVSSDSEDPFVINPCIRKPLNLNRDIS